MNIWLVTIGEPLPIDKDNSRLYRVGMLAEYFVAKGANVLWWTSTHNHNRKKLRHNENVRVEVNKRYQIQLLKGCNYKNNLSIKRVFNHKNVAREFSKLVKEEKQKPDIILSSYPTIELCYEAVKYGKENNIPVILDIRDLWPDAIINLFPKFIKPIVKLAFFRSRIMAGYAFKYAAGIIGISDRYLNFGLRYANRERSVADNVFYLGYAKPAEPSQQDTERQYINIKDKIGLKKDDFIIWFIGSFGKTYDLVTVIEAAKAINKENRNIKFILSGDGEEREKLERLAGNKDNILFTGWVDRYDIAYISSIVDVGLQAYIENAPQGLANKLFEYMCAGIPVLSSLGGENAELVKRYEIGLNYVPCNVDSLVKQINQMYLNRNGFLLKMRNNARAVFDKEFNMVDINAKIYDHIKTFEGAWKRRPIGSKRDDV